jgi:hypothetical protein
VTHRLLKARGIGKIILFHKHFLIIWRVYACGECSFHDDDVSPGVLLCRSPSMASTRWPKLLRRVGLTARDFRYVSMLSDSQVTVVCAKLGKLCQTSSLPLRTTTMMKVYFNSSQINTINSLYYFLCCCKRQAIHADFKLGI